MRYTEQKRKKGEGLTLLGCQATLVTEESCFFRISLLTHLQRDNRYILVTVISSSGDGIGNYTSNILENTNKYGFISLRNLLAFMYGSGFGHVLSN